MEVKAETRVTDIDVRPLPHSDRLPVILGKWQSSVPGDVIRLIVDHNPAPLQYLFRAESPGQFNWEYEKEGPDAWIVRITRTAAASGTAGPVGGTAANEEQERQALKAILNRLNAGEDVATVKEQARDLLRNMDPRKLAVLEQEITREGVGREQMRRLCDVHLEVMKESIAAEQITPEPGHPIYTLMEEHKVLKGRLEELKGYLDFISTARDLKDISREIAGAREVAHQLLEAEPHHQREEQVIFPALEQRGVAEPPMIMREEHVDLRAKKAQLADIVANPGQYSFQDLVASLQEVGGYLVRELANHIYKEDNILYQAALQTVEPEAWQEIKKRCDEIGYCCFTPAGAVGK